MPQNPTSPQPTIRERLEELPYAVFKTINPHMLKTIGINPATYHRVLNCESNHLATLHALADFFKCTIEDVINPEYSFPDPRKDPKQQAALADQLNLSAPKDA